MSSNNVVCIFHLCCVRYKNPRNILLAACSWAHRRLYSRCDNYRVSGALEKLEHETNLQDRAADR